MASYVLKTPITVSGNRIEKVDLREPTFNEICDLGLPGDQTEPDGKLKLLRKYLVVCSGLPEEAVGALGIRDAMALIGKVSDFYNTARFWGERPTELSREPFSRVIELAKEALRIMEEDKKWREKSTASRPSFPRRIR